LAMKVSLFHMVWKARQKLQRSGCMCTCEMPAMTMVSIEARKDTIALLDVKAKAIDFLGILATCAEACVTRTNTACTTSGSLCSGNCVRCFGHIFDLREDPRSMASTSPLDMACFSFNGFFRHSSLRFFSPLVHLFISFPMNSAA
jgi:hypothetical protein